VRLACRRWPWRLSQRQKAATAASMALTHAAAFRHFPWRRVP
jgi:hypothetical protein